MANSYLSAVTAHLHLKGTAKSVAIALANRANDSGVCWPSVKTLSNDTGFSAATVKRSVRKLKDNGYLTVEYRKRGDGSQTSNLYTLIIDAFTATAKKAAKAVKRTFTKAVTIGKQFVAAELKPIKPTSSRIGEEAWAQLDSSGQQTVLDRLSRKTNPTLKQQLNDFGLDSAYVQKSLLNEVKRLKRQKSSSGKIHKTTYEKPTDTSWADEQCIWDEMKAQS